KSGRQPPIETAVCFDHTAIADIGRVLAVWIRDRGMSQAARELGRAAERAGKTANATDELHRRVAAGDIGMADRRHRGAVDGRVHRRETRQRADLELATEIPMTAERGVGAEVHELALDGRTVARIDARRAHAEIDPHRVVTLWVVRTPFA